LDAIGLPLAANTGLLTMKAGIELLTVYHGIEAISDDLSVLLPS
jgi:hypothetical protein